jgi:hypothetical protein
MLAWSLDLQVISKADTLSPVRSLTHLVHFQGDTNSLCKTVRVSSALPRPLAKSVPAADEAGDRICLFGFSRGAYTARALAGMLQKVDINPAPYATDTTKVTIP